MQNKAKNATGEELEKLKREVATAQVEYNAQKKIVTAYYKESYLKELDKIKADKNMRK